MCRQDINFADPSAGWIGTIGYHAMELARRRGRDHPIGKELSLSIATGSHDHGENQKRQRKQALAFFLVCLTT